MQILKAPLNAAGLFFKPQDQDAHFQLDIAKSGGF